MFDAEGTGRDLAAVLVLFTNSDQLALQKFHLWTGYPSVDWTSDGVVISDGRCWE